MSIFLGIDYGQKHIGVAIADGPLASPLISLTASPRLAEQVRELVEKHNAETVVVGIPEGSLEQEVKTFVGTLASHLTCPVVTHPETLSTKEAIAALRAVGGKRKKLQNDHVYAACLILEDYLESVTLSKSKLP